MSAIKEQTTFSDLPQGWTWKNLEDVVDILDSKRIPVNLKERKLRKGPIPYYGATGQVGWIDDYIFDEELVLLGEDGAPFFDPTKPKSYVIKGKSWVNNHAHVLRLRDGIPSAYLKYYLDIVDYHDFVTGTTRAKLNQSSLRKIPIPVAPPDQQLAITAEIEKQFSRLDEAVANLKRAKANLKRYKASVLKAAVEGKLTEEWRRQHPDVEPATELLKRILAERRRGWEVAEFAKMTTKNNVLTGDKWKRKYKDPAQPDIKDLPDIPASWLWVSPEQLASFEDYALAIGPFGSNLKVSDYCNSGIPLVFVKNIRTGSFNTSKYVSVPKAEELKAHKIHGGDILITKMGDPPGDVHLYPTVLPPAIITADCIKWKLAAEFCEVDFFVHILRSQIVKTQISKITKGVAQQKISLARFKTIAVPLLPQKEQKAMLFEIEQRLDVIHSAEESIDSIVRRGERLRQSILKKAFSGNLDSEFQN